MKVKWHKLNNGSFTAPLEGTVQEVKASGRAYLVGKLNNSLFAVDAKCPHAGASLKFGLLKDDANIICPLHRYRFNVFSGVCTSGESFDLGCYPLKEENGQWYIGIEKTGFFS